MSKGNIHIKNMDMYHKGVFMGVNITIGCVCLLLSHKIHSRE